MHPTDQRIRALPLSQNGQRHYIDDAVLGLSVCVGTRKKPFTLIVRKGDKRKRFTLGPYDPPRFTLAHAIGAPITRTYNRAKYIEPMRKALLAFEELLQTQLSKPESNNAKQHSGRDAGVHHEAT